MDNSRKNRIFNALWAPWWMVLPIVVLALFFAFYPEVDMALSLHVYDAQKGGFYLGHGLWTDYADHITSLASALALLGVMFWWARDKWQGRSGKVSGRLVAYFALAFLIGPVLLISLGFKEHWGRNRPVEVVEFGGNAQFTPYWNVAGVCEEDCSFPSGHSSRGFIFVAVAIAAYGFGWRYRREILATSVAFGIFTGIMRVIEGKHFLSDVTLSACIVIYVSWVLFRLLYPESRLPQPVRAA